MISRRFRVVVASMMLVDCCLVGFRCLVVAGIGCLVWVSLAVDVVELVSRMDVGCLDLVGMKQQLRLAVELVVVGLVHGSTLLGPNIAKPKPTK